MPRSVHIQLQVRIEEYRSGVSACTCFEDGIHLGIGGAGAALFKVSFRGLELVDWCSYALPKCSDNVEALLEGSH